MFKPTLNVQTSKQREKNLAVDRVSTGGGPSLGTTGTADNPALITGSISLLDFWQPVGWITCTYV